MEAISQQARSGNRDRACSDTFAARPRPFHDKDLLQNGFGPAGCENRSSSTVPKGLESMLKTTTETGDIGMFSIKPSRVPQSHTVPRRMGAGVKELAIHKTRPPLLPYGGPVVDDRRRLPSYARDNSYEALFLYESGNQRSASRAFDAPDYRSYSMTHTSSSSYTLSNHRSYTSLRSQHDGTGHPQRPRSPFAYPSRLRRAAFRPPSPTLTDGDAMDNSRPFEIDRTYGTGQNTASPSSLYTQKRRPPITPRIEANRSTPSLLSQSSPPRRSSSPVAPRQHLRLGNDWHHKSTIASGNTSPARSALSLVSTVNLLSIAPASSNATAPGNPHPPSPLYYDYTEEFEVELPNKTQATVSPPQFRVEKTIPEDRPMSIDGRAEGQSNISETSDQDRWPGDNKSFGQSEEREAKPFSDGLITQESDGRLPSSIRIGNEGTVMDTSGAGEDKKIIRLSGLEYGAQKSSCCVEEAFGLPSSASFVIDIQPENDSMLNESGESFGPVEEPLSTRTSEWSIGSQFPQFPMPPGTREEASPAQGESAPPTGQAQSDICNNRQSTDSSRGTFEIKSSHRTSRESQCLPPSGRVRVRSSGLNSIDTGLAELAQLIDSSSKPQEHEQKQHSAQHSAQHTAKLPIFSQAIPERQDLGSLQRADCRSSVVPSLIQQRGKELQMLVERQPVKRGGERLHQVHPSSVSKHDTKDVPNFSHQIAPKIMARPESPMLAPKPISPARQLKLKNSIPQIMKALPALPPEAATADAMTACENVRNGDLISLFSPSAAIAGTTHIETTGNKDELMKLPSRPSAIRDNHADVSKHESLGRYQVTDRSDGSNISRNPVPKMKLKVKGLGSSPAVSPSKPYVAEEGESQSGQNSCMQPPLSSLEGSAPALKQPKFKLRVMRASDSTLGTVRVTRDNVNIDLQGGTYPSNPKDLFSPSPGIENTFPQIGRHLDSNSRNTSVSSNHQGVESGQNLPTVSNPLPLDIIRSDHEAGGIMTGVEAQSVFSDDSSQVHGHHSLRKHISKLRTRIAVPYTAKSGAQSYDDITWRDRRGIHILPPQTNHSDSNLYGNRRSSEIKPVRRFVEILHRQRLKEKVWSWINGARSVLARVKHSRAGNRNKSS